MTRRMYGLYGVLLMLGAACVGSHAALALPPSMADEDVTVAGPYTIRQQVENRSLSEPLLTTRIVVEQRVSFADLDLTKQVDVDKMKDRLRHAAKDSCKELDRRFPRGIYIPVDEVSCVKSATAQSLARLDEIRGRYGR